MGMPELLVTFQTKSVSAITRSANGIVAMILKDDTVTTFNSKVYTGIDEVNSSDWTATNYDYIRLAFLGSPAKILVERIPTNASDYSAALGRLKVKRWNYLTIPAIAAGDVTTIATWIKGCRDTDKKTFKAVLPSCTADYEGIINFTTQGIKVGSTAYTTGAYCARLAGAAAGLALSRSLTFYELPEITEITLHTDPNADINNGQLILINDNETIKIARGVNSLTTLTPTKGAQFQKIKLVEGMDLMRDDIITTFNDDYVGKVPNKYNNKLMFIGAVNAYFKQLAGDDVLDASYENITDIDVTAQKTYLQSQGTDVTKMTDQEVKEANTGSKIFVTAAVKFLDAMEDLNFTITL